MSLQQIIAIVIFLCTMGAIITGKVHNTVASLTGAACLVLTHILSIEDCKDCKGSSLANHGHLYFDHSCMFWNA